MKKNKVTKPYGLLFSLDRKRLVKKKFYLPVLKSKLNHYVQYRKRKNRNSNTTDLSPSEDVYRIISENVNDAAWKYEVVQAKEGSYVIRIIEKGKATMYCKVACNESFYEFALREKECYDYLCGCEVKNVVEFLYAGSTSNNEYVIISKALKQQPFKYMMNIYGILYAEIEDFAKKTARTVLFNESDYYKQLQDILANMDAFPDRQLAESVSGYIKQYLSKYDGQSVDYTYYYGDCRVENCAYYKGKVTWYDFQRGKFTYPSGMDKYHLICLYVNMDSNLLLKVLPSFSWYDKEHFGEFMIDFFGRFLTKNEERAQKHKEWFLESYRKLWYSLVL